jgi:hypothetical protein
MIRSDFQPNQESLSPVLMELKPKNHAAGNLLSFSTVALVRCLQPIVYRNRFNG